MAEPSKNARGEVKKYLNPFMQWCDNKYPYTFHVHWASVLHGDLRMGYCGSLNYLIGVTLFLFKKGRTIQRPNGLKGWSRFLQIVNNPSNFKLNFKTGEIQGQHSLGATVKPIEPKAWLKVKKYVAPPGEITARKLRKWWAYMIKVDSGYVQHLTRKEDEFEFYFTNGKTFRGRYILRPYGSNFNFFSSDIGSNKFLFSRSLASKLKEGKEISGFLWIKAEDQTPYVLGRGVKKRFIPPQKHSGLPHELKIRIPQKFQYWHATSEAKRIEIRDQLFASLKHERQLQYLKLGDWNRIKLV